MGPPQLTLCAAVAVCVVTTAPGYAAAERHTAPGTVTAAASATRPLRETPAGPAARHRSPSPQPDDDRPASDDPATNRELSSTSAVGLVLAGGALLVVAGQLLRLRLRLRREREEGGAGAQGRTPS